MIEHGKTCEQVDAISQKVFIKSFCKVNSRQKNVNLSFLITNISDKKGYVDGVLRELTLAK